MIRLIKYKISKYLYKIYSKETQLSESEKMFVQIYLSLLSKTDAELSYIPTTDKKYIKWKDNIAIIENNNLSITSKKNYYSVSLPTKTISKLVKKFNRKLDNKQDKIEREIDDNLINKLDNLIKDIKT